MTTPPPLPLSQLEELLRRIEERPEDRAELVTAAAGDAPELRDAIERWLAEQLPAQDPHELGTIVEDADVAEFQDQATLVDIDAEDGGLGIGPDEGTPTAVPTDEAATLADDEPGHTADESTLLEDEVEGLDKAASGSGRPPGARASSPSPGGSGSSFSTRPRTIEGFEVVKLLGAGGMGSVYLCRQTSPEREVAVKLMLPGLATPRAVQRFEFEIETLAKLSHPNVAKLFEAGLHETPKVPTPYVAMEMVRGARTIIEYADDQGLDLEARLRLFVRACRGVAFGHGRGVIHRDLKPPNLMVDERGEPKVIDFGVALAADDEAGRRELVGTLQYMAPEQASRGEVGTATDVYAMGMILFELLAGEPPYVVPGASLTAALETITTVEVPRISTRLDRIPRDIDAIIAKALTSDPEERYPTAGDLAADLQRYLDDEPTVARAPSFGESVLRIVRKHKLEAGFAVAAVMALIIGLIGVAIFAYQAEAARIQAEQAEGRTRLALEQVEDEQRRMERSLLLFVGVLSDLEPTDIGETMLDGMIEGLDREYAQRGASEDEVVDAIISQRELAEVFSPTDVAARILERHLEEPTIRLLPLVEGDPRTLANLNEFLGQVLAGIGRLEDAEQYYQASIEYWLDLESRRGENVRRASGNFADTLIQQGKIERAIEVLEGLVADSRLADGGLDLDGLRFLNNLAMAQAGEGEIDRAMASFEEALAGYLALPEGEGDRMDREVEMAQVRLNLGSAYLAVGELDKAEPILAAARAQLDGLEDMEESLVQVALGLGRLAFQRSDFETSIERYEEAVAIAVKAFGRGVPLTAEAMYELGSTRFQTGDHLNAIPVLETAREVRLELLGESAVDSLLTGLFLTLSHTAVGNLETAISLLEEVDGQFAAARPIDDPDRLTLLYFFSYYANETGELEGKRAATLAIERLFDACEEADREEPSQFCVEAARLLPKYYDSLIKSDPAGDWETRRDDRFGS